MWRSFRRDKKNVKKFTRLRRCREENVRRCKEIKGQDAYKVKRDVIGIVREGQKIEANRRRKSRVDIETGIKKQRVRVQTIEIDHIKYLD